MLTYAEREACRHATFTKGSGHGYGTPEDGYCPIGAVAALRGAIFEVGPDGEYTSFHCVRDDDGKSHYVVGATRIITEQVEHDILQWTHHKSMTVFLRALAYQGAAMFPPEEDAR